MQVLLNAGVAAVAPSPTLQGVQVTDPRDRVAALTIQGTPTEMVSLLARIADLYGYDLTPRDPGPCACPYGDFYESQGLATPIHECPAEPPTLEDQVEDAFSGMSDS